MDGSTRAINMEKRRQRILSAARATLARDGVDGLTVRKLAGEAGILINEGREDARVADTKTSDADIVTQMDIASEELIRC